MGKNAAWLPLTLPWPELVTVNEYLRRNGIKIDNGTIVDTAIVSAPSSTKNKAGERADRERLAARSTCGFGVA